MTKAVLQRVELPDFGVPERMLEIPARIYEARIARLREMADSRGYEHVVIYADREHSANLAYLSGFDPRFEEGVDCREEGDPAILVGNECWGIAGAAGLTRRMHRFQDFSLRVSRRSSRSLSTS